MRATFRLRGLRRYLTRRFHRVPSGDFQSDPYRLNSGGLLEVKSRNMNCWKLVIPAVRNGLESDLEILRFAAFKGARAVADNTSRVPERNFVRLVVELDGDLGGTNGARSFVRNVAAEIGDFLMEHVFEAGEIQVFEFYVRDILLLCRTE